MFTLTQRKKIFAEQYISNPQAIYQAGTAAWPDDPREGLKCAEEWVDDPEVIKFCGELHASGAVSGVPTKEAIVKEILELARGIKDEPADAIKAYELAAKMLGFIAPPQTNINSKTTVQNRVMVVKDHGNEQDWEAKAQEQQRRLTGKPDGSTPTQH